MLRAKTACTFSRSELPKVVRTPSVLNILTSKCASRHNGVHFFHISTSKSRPTLRCFVRFDFEMCFAPQRHALFRHLNSGPNVVFFVHVHLQMCFAPQRRALFRHRNFQKLSDAEVLCTFSLRNVLRATTACTFPTSQLPKVVRHRGVLYTLTWKCALRHNGVQFFISHLAPLERAYFSTLRSPKSLEKHSVLRLSYLFNPPASFPYRIGTPRCCIKRFFIQVPPQFQLPCLPCFGGL